MTIKKIAKHPRHGGHIHFTKGVISRHRWRLYARINRVFAQLEITFSKEGEKKN